MNTFQHERVFYNKEFLKKTKGGQPQKAKKRGFQDYNFRKTQKTNYNEESSLQLPLSKPLSNQFYENRNLISRALMQFCLTVEDRFAYGYPIEIADSPGCAMVYSVPFADFISRKLPMYSNNSGIYPASVPFGVLHLPLSNFCTNDQYYERNCIRCNNKFVVDKYNFEIRKEDCFCHPGKRTINGWDCCNQALDSNECSSFDQHVWSGVKPGINAPLFGFVRTKDCTRRNCKYFNDVYALDCEMSFTKDGLEVTMVTVVDIDGNIAYNTYVKPENEIIDFNSRFSGVTAKHFKSCKTKTLKQVQNELLSLISADTIIVGHGLENDLRALKIIHEKVIDTAVMFPHKKGFPFRQSLKTLSKMWLKTEIQEGTDGHDPQEDAWTAMRLAIDKVEFCLRNNYLKIFQTDQNV